jgi:hypothetical protein
MNRTRAAAHRGNHLRGLRVLNDPAASAADGPLCLSPSVYRQKFLLKYTLIRTGEVKSASNPRPH